MIIRPPSLRDRMILPEEVMPRGRGRPGAPERQPQQFLLNPYRFGGGGPATDPFWSSVVLSVDTSAMAPGATSFVDLKGGKAITTVGNTQALTNNVLWGSSAAYFDGTGDYLSLADSADWAMGTGDFTVEIVAAPDDGSERYALSQASSLGSFFPFLLGRNASAQFYPRISDGSTITTATTGGTWALSTYRHVAISRVGNTLYSLFNGASLGSISVSGITLMNSTGPLIIGAYGPDPGSTFPWKGWIVAVRITKGVGRYSGSYTVPTGPFPTS
jgi:hypothetical protein